MNTGASDLCVLIGNGLSIAVNQDLALGKLTRDFLERHDDDRAGLERLLSGLGVSDFDADFEQVVGGLESASEVIQAFMSLAEHSANQDLRAAAEQLRLTKVPELAIGLYYAYCLEILEAIGDMARTQLPVGVRSFGDWLKVGHESHRRMGLFTLNYDVLLERMLISDDLLGLKPKLMDYFSGKSEMTVKLVPDTEPLLGRPFVPEDSVNRSIRLHHLHGCLTHFSRPIDHLVLKFDSADLRRVGVYKNLAESVAASEFRPAVILGSNKTGKSREWPFSFAFTQLSEWLTRSKTVIVAGYSFRDEPVNQRLRVAARSGDTRWIVLTLKETQASRDEYIGTVSSTLEHAKVEYLFDGFSGSYSAFTGVAS